MKAIVFDAPGKPEDVLRVREVDVPQPAAGEVLVRIAARPIQPSDLMFIAGRYRIQPVMPQVAGLELPEATVVIDPPNLSERILAATGGVPVAALLDAVGGAAVTRILPTLKPGATIVSYGLLGSEPAQVSNAEMIYRNLRWQGFGVDRWLAHAGVQERAQMVDALWRAIAKRSISLPVKTRYALERAIEAIDTLRTDSGAGKVLLCTTNPQ